MKIRRFGSAPVGRSLLAVAVAMAVGGGMSSVSLAAGDGDARQFDPVIPLTCPPELVIQPESSTV